MGGLEVSGGSRGACAPTKPQSLPSVGSSRSVRNLALGGREGCTAATTGPVAVAARQQHVAPVTAVAPAVLQQPEQPWHVELPGCLQRLGSQAARRGATPAAAAVH